MHSTVIIAVTVVAAIFAPEVNQLPSTCNWFGYGIKYTSIVLHCCDRTFLMYSMRIYPIICVVVAPRKNVAEPKLT